MVGVIQKAQREAEEGLDHSHEAKDLVQVIRDNGVGYYCPRCERIVHKIFADD